MMEYGLMIWVLSVHGVLVLEGNVNICRHEDCLIAVANERSLCTEGVSQGFEEPALFNHTLSAGTVTACVAEAREV